MSVEMTIKPKIFLSYTRADVDRVRGIYRKLSESGFKPWMDVEDILPGERWESSIDKAIRDSDFFFAFLSNNSVTKRGFLQKEIRHALSIWEEKLESDIYLIPVRLEPCEVPESLSKFQWVDILDESGWRQLLKAIREGLNRRRATIASAAPEPAADEKIAPREATKQIEPTANKKATEDDLPRSKPKDPEESAATMEASPKKKDKYSGTTSITNRFLIVCGGSGASLLGQRNELGFAAELQIDARAEILDPKGEERRFHLDLDIAIGSVAELLFETQKRVSEQPDGTHSVYLQKKIARPADIKHINYLVENYLGGVSLRNGLAQSPVIGGAAIKYPINARNLELTIQRMIGEFGFAPGPANPLEFWIVSSTAGGTGEGTHRFVAAIVAEVTRRSYPFSSVMINFIRIGSLTYKTVNPSLTDLHTFFGIAADSALEYIFRREFPHVSVNTFYLDLPDVGLGDLAKRVRGEMIELACKAIILPELRDNLLKLLINNAGAHAVVIRAGFWGKDWDENRIYFEVIKQLVEKLHAFLAPNPSQYLQENQPKVYFDETRWENAESLQSILEDPKYLKSRIDDGWEFPRYDSADLIDSERRERWITVWKMAIGALLGSEIDKLSSPPLIEEISDTESGKSRRTSLSLKNESELKDIFDRIDEAHRARAWCALLLGTGATSGAAQGLLKDLHLLASACSRAMHPPLLSLLRGEDRVKELLRYLWRFFTTLIKVNTLISLDAAARNLLEMELQRPTDVLGYAQREMDHLKNSVGSVVVPTVIAADLSETIDSLEGKSWLEMLEGAILQNDNYLFKTVVLKGAAGLSISGLRGVLDLPPTADPLLIQKTLKERMGHMKTTTGVEYEAQWWQAAPPIGVTMEYNYRILPRLEPGLEEHLRSLFSREHTLSYIFTETGVIGLHILAFQGVSLNTLPGPDTISTYVYLIRPLVRNVQTYLHLRSDNPIDLRTRKVEIASAGVIGDPLDRRVLVEAGLNTKEIEEIGELYEFLEFPEQK